MSILSFYTPNKYEISQIIIRTESIANKSGVTAFELLLQYSNELKKDKPKISRVLKKMSNQLQSGKKKWSVYKGYIDEEILKLLKTAEDKNVNAGKIFDILAPIKRIADQNIKKLKNKIKSPIVIFIILSTIFSFVVKNFSMLNELGGEGLQEHSLFIIENFTIITGTILVIVVYSFVFIPKKMPLIKNIFKKLDSILVLSVTNTLFDVGYSSAEIIPIIVKQFGLKQNNRRNLNASELVEILKANKVIDPLEGADIKLALKYNKFEETLIDILSTNIENIQELNELADEAIKNITILLIGIPLTLTIVVFLDVLRLSSSLM